MAKLPIIFTLLCFSTLIGNSKATIIPPIRFYLSEIVSGPNANIYEVARSNISTTAASFGIVYVADEVLRAGPEPNSPPLARNQGTVVTAGLFEASDVVNFNIQFTVGIYKGSSLKLDGQRFVFRRDQEIPITGGTGFFRGARGYSLSSFVSYNPATDTYLYVYDLYVVGRSLFG